MNLTLFLTHPHPRLSADSTRLFLFLPSQHDPAIVQEVIENMLLGIFLRLAGPILFICMQIAAMWTARKISVARSVHNLPLLPFLSLLVNCVVWTMYGYIEDQWTVVIPNFLGIFAGGYCTYTYHQYSPLQVRTYACACAYAFGRLLF